MKQLTFSSAAYSAKKKVTRREKFLAEMEAVVPWARMEALIAPHYAKGPSAKGGRVPIPLSRMLRIYCLQQWFALSDPAMEESLYDIESMRRFVGIELNEDAIPDETTILHFRHLLERHQLTAALFAEINKHLTERGLMMRQGTIVDATLINAPSSTKNQEGKRDPEMTQTKKGNQWYFGMKAHIGVDSNSGLVRSLVGTTAKVADKTVFEELLTGDEQAICADRGYDYPDIHRAIIEKGAEDWVALKRHPGHALGEWTAHLNHAIAQVRARVEHPFRVLKRQFGYTKVRYRGLAKNTAQLQTLFALVNLYLARRQLQVGPQLVRST